MKKLKDYKCVIGIDTSNYTTSIAAVSLDGQILFEERKMLDVKQGERGLRQSDASFQHMKNFPLLYKNMGDYFYEYFEVEENKKIIPVAVCVSNKPRPVEGSYMPVFLAGEQFASVIATSLNIPLYTTSHQEGHISACADGDKLQSKEYLVFHLSGGTSEILKVTQKGGTAGFDIDIIGGTKDISFGQLIDRIGVGIEIAFPAGEEMDRIALEFPMLKSIDANILENYEKIPAIKIVDTQVNLSGIESHFKRMIKAKYSLGDTDVMVISYLTFKSISDAIIKLTENASAETGLTDVLFVGGVSASEFLREKIKTHFKKKNIRIFFGSSKYSSDNAAGVAFIGRDMYLQGT